jgi:hypothetical protein
MAPRRPAQLELPRAMRYTATSEIELAMRLPRIIRQQKNPVRDGVALRRAPSREEGPQFRLVWVS